MVIVSRRATIQPRSVQSDTTGLGVDLSYHSVQGWGSKYVHLMS